jgi:hypothetical protein
MDSSLDLCERVESNGNDRGPAVAQVLADAELAGHPEVVDASLMERAERADAQRFGRVWAPCTQAYPGGVVDCENERRMRAMCGA